MDFRKYNLLNGTKVVVDFFSPYDIFIGITDKGFEYDFNNNVTGLSHLFEHSVFRHRGENENISYNGSTSFNFITFYNKRKNTDISFFKVCKNLIEKFYTNRIPFVYEFDFDSKLGKISQELENEYYYRKSYDIDGISLFVVNYGKKYLGGRLFDLYDETHIKKKLIELWENIDPGDVLIILKQEDEKVFDLLNTTFGQMENVKKKKISLKKINEITKTLKGNSCILSKCENEFNINIKVDNNKEILKGLFLLSTLGTRVNCINGDFYITLNFGRDPFEIVKYLINESEQNIISNIISSNSKKIYIEDIFHFHKYIDVTCLLEDFLYNDDYKENYKNYLFPVIKNIKNNILNFGNLIINTPPDNILVNMVDLNNEKLFLTEVILDINPSDISELKIKRNRNYNRKERKTTKDKEVGYKKVYLENYNINLYNNIDNYCYFILFYIYNIVHGIRMTSNNIKIIGDRYEIKNLIRRIKEPVYNEYIYKEFCPYFYEALFQFYFFDYTCPTIEDIIWNIKNKDNFRYIISDGSKSSVSKKLQLNNQIYKIKTEYNFLIAVTWIENSLLYNYLLNYLKDIGVVYSMNIFESENYVMFFSLTTNPNACLFEFNRFIKSYDDIDTLYVVSYKSRKLNFNSLMC